MTTPEVIITVVGIILTIAGGYMALRLKPLEDKDETLDARITNINADLDRRITSLHDDAKEARQDLERRLSEIERSYLSRADLTAAIRDMRESMDKGVDRVEQVVRALGQKVDHLADRVGKVEAAP